MNTILYKCYNTGEIEEEPYRKEGQFSVVKKYELLYKEALPRFIKNGNSNIYALPFSEAPKKVYKGLDRIGLDENELYSKNDCLNEKQRAILKQISNNYYYFCGIVFSREEEAEALLSCLRTAEDYELIWTRISGSEEEIPDGYRFAGYDIAYPPSVNGGFSIICDCMFICKWHGCDGEGTLFSEDFNKLNENGLFDSRGDAYSYMVKYLNEDWSERGEYGIYEVYLKWLLV